MARKSSNSLSCVVSDAVHYAPGDFTAKPKRGTKARGPTGVGGAKKVSEKRVKVKVRSILRGLGLWYCTPLGAGFGTIAHDFLVCVPVTSPGGTYGQFVSIETKSSDGRLRPRQEQVAEAIAKVGGIVLLVYPDDLQFLEATLVSIMAGTYKQT